LLHCFTLGGVSLVYDVHSHSLHEVDDLAWALLSRGLHLEPEQASSVLLLADGYSRQEIEEAQEEIAQLISEGLLCAPDPYTGYTPPPFIVKALCLNVAHNCNLSCSYCFAGAGSLGRTDVLMPLATARQAVDFLLSNSGTRRNLEIDFFGGEPLLNMPVVEATVAYARERGRAEGKKFGFTLTTNALLLDDQVSRFLLENGINAVLSIDGRPETHDRLRRTHGGKGSHAQVVSRIMHYLELHRTWPDPKGYCYVRGTFTGYNLDFAQEFRYLAGLGIDDISLEPVVAKSEADYALLQQHLPAIAEEYRRLAEDYLEVAASGREIRLFHFEIDLDGGPCLPKLLSGCGAGHSYLAVSAQGDLYPCHQFIGRESFRIGNVSGGALRDDLIEQFRTAHVYAKAKCRQCWAKFLCSGGCQAHCQLENNDILNPPELACQMMRRRLECALYVRSRKEQLVNMEKIV